MLEASSKRRRQAVNPGGSGNNDHGSDSSGPEAGSESAITPIRSDRCPTAERCRAWWPCRSAWLCPQGVHGEFVAASLVAGGDVRNLRPAAGARYGARRHRTRDVANPVHTTGTTAGGPRRGSLRPVVGVLWLEGPNPHRREPPVPRSVPGESTGREPARCQVRPGGCRRPSERRSASLGGGGGLGGDLSAWRWPARLVRSAGEAKATCPHRWRAAGRRPGCSAKTADGRAAADRRQMTMIPTESMLQPGQKGTITNDC